MKKIKDEHKLLRIKVSLEIEVVGDDIYLSDDIQRAGEGIFHANKNDIFTEAMDGGNGMTIKVSEIKTKADLPVGYTERTLPWLNVSYGNKDANVRIGEILKK